MELFTAQVSWSKTENTTATNDACVLYKLMCLNYLQKQIFTEAIISNVQVTMKHMYV